MIPAPTRRGRAACSGKLSRYLHRIGEGIACAGDKRFGSGIPLADLYIGGEEDDGISLNGIGGGSIDGVVYLRTGRQAFGSVAGGRIGGELQLRLVERHAAIVHRQRHEGG